MVECLLPDNQNEAGATANLTESFEYAAAQDAREAQANQVQFLSNQMKTLTETCRKMEGTLRHQGTLLEEKDREIENRHCNIWQ